MSLDDAFKNRNEEYHMKDGAILDSNTTYWRDIGNWDQLQEIVVNLNGMVHRFPLDDNDGFIRCRVKGRDVNRDVEAFRFGDSYEFNNRTMVVQFNDGSTVYTGEVGWREADFTKLVGFDVQVGGDTHRFIRRTESPLLDDCIHYSIATETNLWCIGLIKGDKIIMTDMNFQTGEEVETRMLPLNTFPDSMIHPTLMHLKKAVSA